MIRVGRLLPGGIVIEEGHHRPIKGAAILQSESGDVEEVIVFAKQLQTEVSPPKLLVLHLVGCSLFRFQNQYYYLIITTNLFWEY